MRLVGKVTHGLKDPKTGMVVAEKEIANTVSATGLVSVWSLMTGTDTENRIRGMQPPPDPSSAAGAASKARLHIFTGQNIFEKVVEEPAAGYPQVLSPQGAHARAQWRWEDRLPAAYTATSLQLARSATETAVASVTIRPGERVAKTANLIYFVVWRIFLQSGGPPTGAGGPSAVISQGLKEVLRPVIADPFAILSLEYLEAYLVAEIAVTPGGVDLEDPRQQLEVPLVLSNWRTMADNPGLGETEVQFDATLDPRNVGPDGFLARGLDIRLKWGGGGDTAVPETRRVIIRLELAQAIQVSQSTIFERTYRMGLVSNAPPEPGDEA